MKPCILNMKLEINMRASLRSGLAPAAPRHQTRANSLTGAAQGCTVRDGAVRSRHGPRRREPYSAISSGAVQGGTVHTARSMQRDPRWHRLWGAIQGGVVHEARPERRGLRRRGQARPGAVRSGAAQSARSVPQRPHADITWAAVSRQSVRDAQGWAEADAAGAAEAAAAVVMAGAA